MKSTATMPVFFNQGYVLDPRGLFIITDDIEVDENSDGLTVTSEEEDLLYLDLGVGTSGSSSASHAADEELGEDPFMGAEVHEGKETFNFDPADESADSAASKPKGKKLGEGLYRIGEGDFEGQLLVSHDAVMIYAFNKLRL